MSDDDRLEELARRWEESRARGQSTTPEELCRDCPGLLDALRQRIAKSDTGSGPEATTAPVPPPPSAPAFRGVPSRYEPLRLHARGGLGEVHVAFDRELHREVALKFIQDHLADNIDLQKRFLLEAEVTGRLEHPGVVPVYGMGVDGEGRPFYAMRLIRGESFHEAIARFHAGDAAGRDPGERQLSLRALLTRFVAVCNAVAYAHFCGIVHRDLKPANVMLGPFGETLVVDWGLARTVSREGLNEAQGDDPLTPTNRPKATHGVAGSPAYMSPEQAAGQQSQVGHASDVYSLGATLYHLLTGSAPIDRGSLDEVLARVKRGDFPPPRSRKATVPAALEAVCLKAMALAPDARYRGADELAEDIEAFLADEPVQAWREPWTHRARRWLKRRRTAVVTTLAAGAVALVALAVSTVLLQAAWNREIAARTDAEDSAARERKQRERAEGLFQLAEGTGGTLLDLAEEIKPAAEVQARTTEHVLVQARRRYEQLRREGGDRPVVMEGQARVLTALSEVRITLGDTSASRDEARDAVSIYRLLRRRNPDSVRYQAGEAAARENLAQALTIQGDLASGQREHRAALALRTDLAQQEPAQVTWPALMARSHNFLGNLLRTRGLDRSAEAEYRLALELSRRALAGDGKNALARGRVATSLEKLGDAQALRDDLAGATRYYQQALDLVQSLLRDGHGTTATLQHQAQLRLSLGLTLHNLRQPDRARVHYEQATGDCERFFQLDPSNREWERLRMQAAVYSDQFRKPGDPLGESRALAELFRASLETIGRRVARDPANIEWATQQAGVRRLLAESLLAQAKQGTNREKNLAEAGRLLAVAGQELEALHKRVPDNLLVAEWVAAVGKSRLVLKRLGGEGPPMVELARKQLAFLEAYYRGRIKEGADVTLWEARLAEAYRRAATDRGWINEDRDVGLRAAREGASLYEKVHQQEPGHAPWLLGVAECHEQAQLLLTGTWAETKRKGLPDADVLGELLRHLGLSVEARKKLIGLQPGELRWHRGLAEAYRQLADFRRLQGDEAGEDRDYRQYLDTLEGLYRQFPEEAARDPFIDQGPATAGASVGGQAVAPGTANIVQALEDGETLHWAFRKPRQAVDNVKALIVLVQRLDLKDSAKAREARWAVRRGLGLLRELQAANALHLAHARMVPYFEAKLRQLNIDGEEGRTPEGWRRAWQGLDFAGLLRAAREQGRLGEAVSMLDRLVEGSAGIPWVVVPVRYRMLEACLLERGLPEAVLAESRKQAGRLSKSGREQFAWLARLVGDEGAARDLASEVLRQPPPHMLLEVLSYQLGLVGQLRLGARLQAEVTRAKGAKATADDHSLAGQIWLGANQPAEAVAAFREAVRLAPNKGVHRLRLAEALLAASRLDEVRKLASELRAGKDWPADAVRDWRTLQALLLAEEGQVSQAEKELRELRKATPEDAKAGPALAILLAEAGKDLGEAARLTESMRKKHPASPAWALADAAVKLASGKAKEALPELEKLAKHEPTCFDPVVFALLGEASSKLGRNAEARASWQKALDLLPGATAGDRLVKRLRSRLEAPTKGQSGR